MQVLKYIILIIIALLLGVFIACWVYISHLDPKIRPEMKFKEIHVKPQPVGSLHGGQSSDLDTKVKLETTS